MKGTNTKMGKQKKDAMEVAWLPEDQLLVNPLYQRSFKQTKVDRIIANFDVALVDPVRVWKVGDEEYEAWDGQHTAEALRQLGWRSIPCKVLNGKTTLEDVAGLFVIRNTGSTQLRPLEIFKAELVNKNAKALAINRIVEEYGLRIASGLPNGIAAIQKVKKIYDDAGGETALRDVLHVVTEAWDADERDRLHGNILLGVNNYLIHDAPNIERLIPKLKRVSPTSLLRKAHAEIAHEGGGNVMASAVENQIRLAVRRRRI